MTRWIFWAVPEPMAKRYAIGLILLIYVFPSLFGVYYTKIGAIINILWYDIIFYVFSRAKENRKDKDESDRME
jgi:hypothetical protein|tara:strand:+ start:382 stop:600 length:219 start_codon:yes stop_codon:yes gene_type:complete